MFGNNSSPFNVRPQMNVVRLLLQDTGTYDPVMRRPFGVTLTDQSIIEQLGNRIEHSISSGNIGSGIFAGLSNSVMCPSAVPVGNIFIPNGWGQRRFRFTMEVLLNGSGNTSRFIIQGYTEHGDVSLSGHIDPNMRFICNSYCKLNRISKMNGLHVVQEDVLVESSQIIDGVIINSIGTENALARPYDIFNVIANGNMVNHNTGGLLINESRMSLLNGIPSTSKRRNNVSGNFLSSIANNFLTSSAYADFGDDHASVFSRSAESVYETVVAELDFFAFIKSFRGHSAEPATTFSFAEINALDPNADNNTTILRTREMQRVPQFNTDGMVSPLGFNQSQQGDTSGWNGQNIATVIATILSNTIPGLMMESMLDFAWFTVSNGYQGGTSILMPKNIKSMTGADTSVLINAFINKICNEVMRDISANNNYILNIECCCDIYGDFWLEIQVDGMSVERFIAPAYADGLFAPVITPSVHSTVMMAQQLETVCNLVREVGGSKIQPSIFNSDSNYI